MLELIHSDVCGIIPSTYLSGYEYYEPSPEIVALEDHDMLEREEPTTMDIYQKRKTTQVREIIQEEEKYGALEGSTITRKRSNAYSSYVALMRDLIDKEPTNYDEAAQKK